VAFLFGVDYMAKKPTKKPVKATNMMPTGMMMSNKQMASMMGKKASKKK
jgi:hypothetical protein